MAWFSAPLWIWFADGTSLFNLQWFVPERYWFNQQDIFPQSFTNLIHNWESLRYGSPICLLVLLALIFAMVLHKPSESSAEVNSWWNWYLRCYSFLFLPPILPPDCSNNNSTHTHLHLRFITAIQVDARNLLGEPSQFVLISTWVSIFQNNYCSLLHYMHVSSGGNNLPPSEWHKITVIFW